MINNHYLFHHPNLLFSVLEAQVPIYWKDNNIRCQSEVQDLPGSRYSNISSQTFMHPTQSKAQSDGPIFEYRDQIACNNKALSEHLDTWYRSHFWHLTFWRRRTWSRMSEFQLIMSGASRKVSYLNIFKTNRILPCLPPGHALLDPDCWFLCRFQHDLQVPRPFLAP